MGETTTQTDETRYEHPIAQKHIFESRHDDVNAHTINKLLEEINKRVNEDTIDDIDGATPYDNKAENDDTVAAWAEAIWADLFDEIGLTFNSDEHTEEYVDETQWIVMAAHKNHGIDELDMDHQNPVPIIVASKQ